MQNALKSNEWQNIWVERTLKIEIQKGGSIGHQIIQTFCKIGLPLEIGSPLINLKKFQGSDKITPESWTVHWNLMNDKEFGSRKLLKLKYRRGDQIIQTFCKIGSPQKLGPPSLICRNLKTLREVLLNHTKCIES